MFEQVKTMVNSLRTRASGLRPNLVRGNLASSLGAQVGGGQLMQQARQLVSNTQARVNSVMQSRPTPAQDAMKAATGGDGLLATSFGNGGPISGFRGVQVTPPVEETGNGYRVSK